MVLVNSNLIKSFRILRESCLYEHNLQDWFISSTVGTPPFILEIPFSEEKHLEFLETSSLWSTLWYSASDYRVSDPTCEGHPRNRA